MAHIGQCAKLLARSSSAARAGGGERSHLSKRLLHIRRTIRLFALGYRSPPPVMESKMHNKIIITFECDEKCWMEKSGPFTTAFREEVNSAAELATLSFLSSLACRPVIVHCSVSHFSRLISANRISNRSVSLSRIVRVAVGVRQKMKRRKKRWLDASLWRFPQFKSLFCLRFVAGCRP